MALNEYLTAHGPLKLGSTDIAIHWGDAVPDGNTPPFSDMLIGSFYIYRDETAEYSPVYLKVDEQNSNDDWVKIFVDKQLDALSLNGILTMLTDIKIQFRDNAIFIHSNADGYLHIQADGGVTIGDGTNQAAFSPSGVLSFEGTGKPTKRLSFPLAVGGGTADVNAILGAASIRFDADLETALVGLRVPSDWDGASDITIFLDVENGIAETDGDDISFDGQVRGYADGETASDAGQAVTFLLDLTGGDQAQYVVNRVTGTIDYDHGTYPIAANDTLIIELTVNLGAGTECTGPLHVLAWGLEYTASS